jgi:predicted acylesterase/phospholipase RssA
VLGNEGWRVRANVGLQVVTARARGALERSSSRTAFARAVLGNALSRRNLGAYFERVVFHAGDAPFLEQPFDRCGLQRVPLNATNVTDALLASGTVPIVSSPVRDIAGAPSGSYWDGALVDYHLLVPYAPLDGRIVLYPHFNDFVTPGWLDKHLPWRRAPRGHEWLDDVLLIAPSPAFLATLPNGKLPDRRDFYRYASDHAARERAWSRAAAECERFAVQALEWLARPDPTLIAPL